MALDCIEEIEPKILIANFNSNLITTIISCYSPTNVSDIEDEITPESIPSSYQNIKTEFFVQKIQLFKVRYILYTISVHNRLCSPSKSINNICQLNLH